ncbi:MAG: ATP-binding protein [Campylobacterota bacterium]|nr:ATP-binding protein [Campylobacterota bacterium]
MKNRIIVVVISAIFLSMSYNIYNFSTSNYEYKHILQNKMESFEIINNKIDKRISDSANYMYYNLDYIEDEFVKVDNFFEDFSKEEIILQDKMMEKKLENLKSLFQRKDFLNYKFQKTNVTLKNSTIYLSILLLKSQNLFSDPAYLSLVNRTISDIYLAKSSNDKDFLINLKKNIAKFKKYDFNSEDKKKFNAMLVAHLNVYDTKYEKYVYYLTQLSDDIYATEIESFRDMVYQSIYEKILSINIYLWLYGFSLLISVMIILHLIKKVELTHKDLKLKTKEQENLLLLFEKQVKEKTDENVKQAQVLLQQSKMAAMGEMIGSIAHQWRQPLNEIGINIQKLKYDYRAKKVDEDFIYEFIKKNKRAIDFMSTTIDDFRNFFRIDKEKDSFSVKKAIKDVASMQSAQLKNSAITLNILGDDFEIDSFKNEFQQAVFNIITNAKDTLVENDIKNPTIDITLQENKLTIEDNARGVPQEILERIFEPYFTTKEQGKGTGMGLYISKMIIEDNMNGELSVSNSDNGALFEICFSKELTDG